MDFCGLCGLAPTFPLSPCQTIHLFPSRQELEQTRHELRLKLEGCQTQWESQVGDLERDVRELSARVEQLSRALSEAEKDKSRTQLDHCEHTQRLREQLNTVSDRNQRQS